MPLAADFCAGDATTSWGVLSAHSVTIRAMDSDDAMLESEFLSRLSPETRHRRFLGPAVVPVLSVSAPPQSRSSRLALAASITFGGAEEYIGVATYVSDAPFEADFAMVIADAWQGCGVGRRLMTHLVQCASQRGIRKLSGDVLADNRPMLSLAGSLGFRITSHPDGALLRRVELPGLPEPGAAR